MIDHGLEQQSRAVRILLLPLLVSALSGVSAVFEKLSVVTLTAGTRCR